MSNTSSRQPTATTLRQFIEKLFTEEQSPSAILLRAELELGETREAILEEFKIICATK